MRLKDLFKRSTVQSLPPIVKTREQYRAEFDAAFAPWRNMCIQIGMDAQYLDMRADCEFDRVQLWRETRELEQRLGLRA